MEQHFFSVEGVAAAVAISAQGWMGMRWMYKRMRSSDITNAFIRALATNHLPHIQECLNIIAAKVKVELPPPPPVQWVDLNGKDYRDSI